MLEVKYATKYYAQSIGIENIYMNVEAGEVVGLFGENGAGKTTLLKAIMGLVRLNSGEVIIDGKNNLDAFEQLSFITEEGSWFPDLTSKQHGEFFANLLDCFNVERFYKLLDYFSIDVNKKAGSMSKGQSAKLEAAIGFSKGAKYIIMDEPFSGKDIFTRRDFLKMMIGSLKNDEAIIIATHLPDEVSGVITRAVVLKEGRKLRDVPLDKLEEEHITLEEFLRNVYGYDEKRINKYL